MTRKITSVYQLICNMKEAYASNVAVRYYDEGKEAVCSVLYGQVYEDICRCAAFLKKKIPGERPHVAILGKNSYFFIVHVFAAILADMVAVPLNYQKSPDELCYETEFADVTAILHDGGYLEREPSFTESCSIPFISMNAFLDTAPLTANEPINPDALSMILFTSGTTAKSKGVMISQNNLFSAIEENVAVQITIESNLGIREYRMGTFIMLPLYHVAGLIPFFPIFSCGQSVNICSDPRKFYRDIAIMPSDYITLVPVMLDPLHKDVMAGKNRYGQIRAINTSAAPVSPELLNDMVNKGFFMLQGYGMTETAGGAITMNIPLKKEHIRSIGKPINGVECKLEGGELCVRSKIVMLGYYKDSEATSEIIDSDGWLHTGDLAQIDEDGYYYLVGRKKNLIILGSGENINPEELENQLYKHSDIAEAVVGEKDGKICAKIYCPTENYEAVEKYVADLNKTLPMYKHISFVEFRSEPFERTSTGKIKRT